MPVLSVSNSAFYDLTTKEDDINIRSTTFSHNSRIFLEPSHFRYQIKVI